MLINEQNIANSKAAPRNVSWRFVLQWVLIYTLGLISTAYLISISTSTQSDYNYLVATQSAIALIGGSAIGSAQMILLRLRLNISVGWALPVSNAFAGLLTIAGF